MKSFKCFSSETDIGNGVWLWFHMGKQNQTINKYFQIFQYFKYKSSYRNCYPWTWASGRDHLNSKILTHFRNNSCNKSSAGKSFLTVLRAVIYCRLTGGEPTALISHISIQDRMIQRPYCLHNWNECISRMGRRCSLLVGYAERRSLLCLCIFF